MNLESPCAYLRVPRPMTLAFWVLYSTCWSTVDEAQCIRLNWFVNSLTESLWPTTRQGGYVRCCRLQSQVLTSDCSVRLLLPLWSSMPIRCWVFRGADLQCQTQSRSLHRATLHSQAGHAGGDWGPQRPLWLQGQRDAPTKSHLESLR